MAIRLMALDLPVAQPSASNTILRNSSRVSPQGCGLQASDDFTEVMTGCCFSGVNAGFVPMMINISFHMAPRVKALTGVYVFVIVIAAQ